jgi:2-keto-4-pentenoate hydratase/2-oxohepta-3-ene-1,7-dioic acid hydratase in catechol pathway
MKLAVFDDMRVGVVEDDMIFDVTAVIGEDTTVWPPVFMNRLIADWAQMRPRIEAERARVQPQALSAVRLGPPSPYPTHIVATPANYHKHLAEMGALAVTPKGKTAATQGFFLLSNASLCGVDRGVELPLGYEARRFDHESELAVLIGRTARNVPRARALEHVFGYSCLIDVTMRIDGENNEERVMRKSFETFTPMGPWIVTADEVGDPGNLRNQLWVNDDLRHEASTADLIVDVPALVEMASSIMTLYPGDIIATGTPEGIGPIVPGDTVTIKIERVGSFSTHVTLATELPPRVFPAR